MNDMDIKLAKTAGFCFGVKRAVDMCYEEAEKGGIVYTLGPIIHNEDVVADLEEKGVHVAEDIDSIKEGEGITVIIRSHGISKDVFDRLSSKNVRLIDATCPFVDKIHKIVSQKYSQGDQIIIIGNELHPEVEGINGWCNNKAIVIETPEEAMGIKGLLDPSVKKLCVVAQTTFNHRKFKDIVDILSKMSYDVEVMNTICNATEERQTEACTIAKQSDAMLVIGGRHSSNTQKLYEICKVECPDTYFIQTLDDLDLVQLNSFRSVGITAGASTPIKIIKEVQSYVRSK